jgi:hypothetical protein
LAQAALDGSGALHRTRQRQQTAGQKQPDQNRDHQLDQRETALRRARGAAMAKD